MKLMVALPFLANKRAEFSLGYGQLEDNYFQSSVIDFDKDRSDRSTYKLLGGSIGFYGSTLNTRQYATKGYLEKLIAQVFTGRERFEPGYNWMNCWMPCALQPLMFCLLMCRCLLLMVLIY